VSINPMSVYQDEVFPGDHRMGSRFLNEEPCLLSQRQ
jgi:hypothetical protein